MSDERRLGRRELLEKSAIAAASLGAVGALAPTAGAQRTAATARAAATSINLGVHQFLWEPTKALFDEFTANTGIALKLSDEPGAGGDQVTQMTPQLAAGSTPVDVFNCADESGLPFANAGWLEPVTDVWNAVKSDYPPEVQAYVAKWASKNGEVYRIPNTWAVSFYWVRRDVLNSLGAKAPATWDDILKLAPKAKKKGMYVFGDAASKPSLAFAFMAFLTSQSGGTLFNFDAKTRAAFEFAKEMVDSGAYPKNALTWNYDQQNAAYVANKLITMRQWNFFESVATGTPKWFKRSKAEIVLPPAGPAGRGTWASTWGWGIPKASEHKDEAREFIKFIASAKNAPKLAKVNSYYAQPRHSIIKAMSNDYFIKSMGAYSKAGVVKGRPFNVKIGPAQGVVDTIVTAFLTGQMSLNSAMTNGRKQIKQL